MRCPKCQYISFDNGERCRNCGYEFSLSVEAEALDLPIQTGDEAEGPLSDFPLEGRDRPTTPPMSRLAFNLPATPVPEGKGSRSGPSRFDLPLFGDRQKDDDRPLVSAPAVPRAPLAVRKAAPEQKPAARRPGADPHEPELTFADEPTPRRAQPRHVADDARSTPAAFVNAGAGSRLLAALIDVLVLAAIDAVVLHYTLKLCGFTYSEIRLLPAAPFIAFLFMLNGGYVAAFTAAGGQSIGKMVAGIRVVPSDANAWSDGVPLGQAVLRSASYLASALPAGLGFVPAFIGADRRAVHDRLAHTRVVKA